MTPTLPDHGGETVVPHDVDWSLETSFDRYARLVRHTIDVPVGLVTIVESDRQVFPGALGLPEPWQSERQTPLTHSFCQYVVADQKPLVVSDARLDDRLRDNLAIPDLGVVAYAGWPLHDASGTVVGSLCAIHDEPHAWTTEELQNLEDLADACSAELAQRELVDQLAASNERLGAFAGQVSHDLRNPLTALTASLELLDEIRSAEVGSPDALLLLRAMRSTRRMSTLVSDVLLFAQVGGALRRSTVDVGELIAGVIEDLHLDPDTLRISVGDLADVDADPVQLAVLVQNLIANAGKHAPGAPIEVSSVVEDGVWCLTVADHGPGIAPSEREHVFESFVRLDPTVTGSGLGLATCLRVVRAHDGDIRLEETPGGGTTVRVRFPVAA